MTLYQKLFGRVMAPAGEDEGSSGGRGDEFVPTVDDAAKEPPASASDEGAGAGEGAGEDEGEEPPARDSAGKFAKKVPTIPKPEFDRRINKEREARETAERQLAELQKQQQQVTRTADITKLEGDVKDLRTKERKALIDGDEDKAAQFASEADRLNRQIAINQSAGLSAQDKEQAMEQIRMEMTIERIEELYPALNQDSDEFDQDITDDVLDKQRGYMERERLSPSKALLKAAKYVMARFSSQETQGEKTGLSAAASSIDRKAAAVAKNVDAAKRQPAAAKQVGADSDKHGQNSPVGEASQMTPEEFAALPETTRAKMRGDML